MTPAYRLVHPDNPSALPQLWEYEQPHIHNIILNARMFDRRVDHRYFRTWSALARENARIWETHYRWSPMYAPWRTWEAWLAEYRTLVVEVHAIYEAHEARCIQRTLASDKPRQTRLCWLTQKRP
jgi:hypothetical protein